MLPPSRRPALSPPDAAVSSAGQLVAARLGLDFRSRGSANLERGLARGARAAGFRAVGDYLQWMRTQPADSLAWRLLAGELTVGESYFFRDRCAHDALADHVLPALIGRRRREGVLRLRLWSAGCSTGEEPYTLAILLRRLVPDIDNWRVTLLGTDVDPRALEAAARGEYRKWSLRATPAWARERYFARRGADKYELAPEIRAMVAFAPLNLVAGPGLAPAPGIGAMDLILCRNVLMYLTPEAQRGVVGQLRRALHDGGWMALSPAEASAELLRPLVPVHFSGAVLHTARAAPMLAAPPPPRRRDTADATVPPSPSPSPAPAVPEPTAAQRARAAADLGRLEHASELCREALAQDALDGEVHLLLAAIHHERRERAAALESARAAIYSAPASARAHFLLGSLLLQRGPTAQGRQSMETAATLLDSVPPDEPVAPGEATTAGELLAAARAHLALAP